jgi:hypothetical protein
MWEFPSVCKNALYWLSFQLQFIIRATCGRLAKLEKMSDVSLVVLSIATALKSKGLKLFMCLHCFLQVPFFPWGVS